METVVGVLALLIFAAGGWILRDRTVAPLLRKCELEGAQATAKAEVLASELQDEKIARATAEAGAQQVAALEAALADLRLSEQQLIREKAELEAERRTQQQTFDEKAAALMTLRGEIEKEIKALANDALKGNQDSFLKLANEVFEKHKTAGSTDLEQRKKDIETLLAPLSKTLSEMEKARTEAYGGLLNELHGVALAQNAVRSEASKLVNALRAAPKTRGRWGEHQLQNVLELAGMTPYVDFDLEESFVRGDERLRPDAVLRLPGERHIVLDAKTSITAYLDAVEAVDDETRELHLRRHAEQMRQHVKKLAAKSYWDGLRVTPDVVVMFVPGDNFFSAAIERDPDLFEFAVKSRVLIATPTTMIALAKAIAFGWRQEKAADGVRRVAELGRDLYKRLQAMAGHIQGAGSSLENAVKAFNKFVGSLEASVMPQARKFTELEVEGTQDPLLELEPIETDIRQLRTDRDFVSAPDTHLKSLGGNGAPAA